MSFSRQEAKRQQVEHLVTLFHADTLTADVSAATVVTLFLTPEANLLLRPKLQRQLRPGARVVSHEHHMGDWAPERVEHVRARSGTMHTLYLWADRKVTEPRSASPDLYRHFTAT